jgi:hypothetical protein
MQEVSSNRFPVYPNEQVAGYGLRVTGYGLRVAVGAKSSIDSQTEAMLGSGDCPSVSQMWEPPINSEREQ